MYVLSIQDKDYSMFMALSMFYCLVGLVSNIIIDISYGFIDPRIRMGEERTMNDNDIQTLDGDRSWMDGLDKSKFVFVQKSDILHDKSLIQSLSRVF